MTVHIAYTCESPTSSPGSGEEGENKKEHTSDDAYFKQTMAEISKKRNNDIKVNLPAVGS